MKEITRIHLAKKPFEIEIDAKKDLQKYLEDIEVAVQSSDVMYEIETRVIEILLENGVEIGGVISSVEVAKIKNQMGEVGDFIDDAESGAEQKSTIEEKPKKRLMRDTENNVAAGVAAGMATYFNIDVNMVRLIWVLITLFTSGAGFIFYIIAALILPAAKTSSEKLQMHGLSPTIENITTKTESSKQPNKAHNFFMNSVRVILSLGFGLALVSVVAAMVFGTYVSISAINSISAMESQPLMIAIFVFCLMGGFGLLMVLSSLIIASAIWKMNKVLLWILVAGMAISAISAGVVSATAARFSSDFLRERENNYSFVDIQLPENLEGVKYIKTSENLAPYTITVDARNNPSEVDDKITAKLKYLNINNKTEAPKVHIERVDDTLVVSVDGKKYCYGGLTFFDTDCLTRDYIIEFHGPVTYRYNQFYENEIPETIDFWIK